jgi:cytochrome b subunit of formate dehydrogenase
MHVYLGMSPTAIRVGAAAVVMREAGMRHIAVLFVLGLLVVSLVHLVAGARLARLAGVPEAAASGPAPDLGAPIRWVHACAWALMLALVATGVGFLVTYGPSPLPTFFSSRWAVRVHVAAGLAFAGLAPLLALAWIVVGLGRRRAADWLNAWGGFLWMARGRGDGKLSAVNQFWIWVDFLCCLAVAATGVIMAMRVPSVGRLAPEALRRLADHALVGPLAYSIHGLAGSVLIARLAGHLYALIFFRKRGETPVPPGC